MTQCLRPICQYTKYILQYTKGWSLGIMGAKFRPPETPWVVRQYGTEELKRGLKLGPHQAERRSILIYIYTQRNLFEILLNQTEIGLYLPFFD